MDAQDIANVFAENEVDRIYLNFSDPWPKARHARRRLTSPDFFARYDKVLVQDGQVEFKTDNRDLFDFSVESLGESETWGISECTYDLHHDEIMNVGNIMTEYEEKFLVDFWAAVVKNMEPWNELVNHGISKKDLRENYIAVQGVVIQALGRIGEFIYQNELKISEEMKKLKGINWKRNAQEWKNRTIRQDGRIIANETAIILTGNKLKSLSLIHI